jgi:cation diffusion facilitator CzcD-associated flavoprotein CzcO
MNIAIPQLAKWAKELYVFQRTPSAVSKRDNSPTDPETWKNKIAGNKGWQRERAENFDAFVSHILPPPAVNMVDDEWSKIPTCYALYGRPHKLTPADVPAYLNSLRTADLPQQDKVRARVEELVHDKATAEKLKPWYNSVYIFSEIPLT